MNFGREAKKKGKKIRFANKKATQLMPKGKKAHAKSGELEAFELFAAQITQHEKIIRLCKL